MALAMALSLLAFTPATRPIATAPLSATAVTKAPYSASTLRWLIHQSFLHTFDVPRAKKAKSDMSYYWYSYPSDGYVDYNTVAGEEWNLWVGMGGVEVDTNPIGGILLEKGYLMYGTPHGVVYEFLYGHFLM